MWQVSIINKMDTCYYFEDACKNKLFWQLKNYSTLTGSFIISFKCLFRLIFRSFNETSNYSDLFIMPKRTQPDYCFSGSSFFEIVLAVDSVYA